MTDLLDLLHQAAPPVDPPPDGLDRVRQRARAMRRRGTAARLLVVPLAAAVLMAGLAVSRDDSRVRVGPAGGDEDTPVTTSAPASDSPVPTTSGAAGPASARTSGGDAAGPRTGPGAPPAGAQPAGAPAATMVFQNGDGLWAMRLDGTGKRLVKRPAPWTVFGWSADARSLLVGVQEADSTGARHRTKVALLSVADGSQRVVLDPAGYSVISVAMSADGRRLVYSAVEWHPVLTNQTSRYYVFVADADGRNQRQLVEGIGPAWSPDGSRIVFKCDHPSGWTCVMNADGSGLHAIGWMVPPFAWSPDGTWIAWFAGDQLHLNRPDGSGERTVALRAKSFSTPQWTPDSTRVVYARYVTQSDSAGRCSNPPCDQPPGIFATAVDRPGDHIRLTTSDSDDRPFVAMR